MIHTSAAAVKVPLFFPANSVDLVQDLKALNGCDLSTDGLIRFFEFLHVNSVALAELTQNVNEESDAVCEY